MTRRHYEYENLYEDDAITSYYLLYLLYRLNVACTFVDYSIAWSGDLTLSVEYKDRRT